MIADLKPYPEYRESGELWLGQLPTSWKLRRAKFLYQEIDDRSKSGKEELLSVSHKTGVTPRSQKSVTMFLAKSNVGHKVCRPQDLVINTLWAWMAALGVSRHTGIVSPAYGVYRPLAPDQFLPRFADLLLRTPLYAAEYLRRSTGVNSSRLRLYPEDFLRISILLPPPTEQAAIVRFLDHWNGRLEKAIRSKRRVIALLQQQKQAIIHRAVTCGLDPNVKLKDSGIPWLGDIPEHWGVSRVKNEFDCLNNRRIPLSSPERGKMTKRDYDYYGASGIIDRVDDYLFDGELLLIAEDGANLVLRNLPLAIIARGKFWVNNHAHILKPKGSSLEYLQAVMEGISYRPWISGAAQPKLTKDRLLAIAITVAPANEQTEIMDFVRAETAPIVAAIARYEREITLLREYRTRLTADVVTGKLDVRAAAAQLPEQAEDESLPDPELPEEESELEEVEG
jgi:type I restriction enzyme S subunit